MRIFTNPTRPTHYLQTSDPLKIWLLMLIDALKSCKAIRQKYTIRNKGLEVRISLIALFHKDNVPLT